MRSLDGDEDRHTRICSFGSSLPLFCTFSPPLLNDIIAPDVYKRQVQGQKALRQARRRCAAQRQTRDRQNDKGEKLLMSNPIVTIEMEDGGIIRAELYPEIPYCFFF